MNVIKETYRCFGGLGNMPMETSVGANTQSELKTGFCSAFSTKVEGTN